MPKKRTRIREARTTEEFREAVVERWHEVYRAVPAPPPFEEIVTRRPASDRGEVRRSFLGPGRRPPAGGGFLGRRPMDDDDFDDV